MMCRFDRMSRHSQGFRSPCTSQKAASGSRLKLCFLTGFWGARMTERKTRMATTIDTIFEKGVFRPLQPVVLPENRHIRINFEDPAVIGNGETAFPRLPPREYPEEYPDVTDADFEYRAVPPKAIHTVQANVIFAGRLTPAPYPDEE